MLTDSRGLLADIDVDAIVLTQSANVAWLTNGARTYVNMATEGAIESFSCV